MSGSEEAAMSVVMLIDNPNGSQEIYQKVSSGFTLPIGGRVHVAGPRPGGGWRVIEVWATGGAGPHQPRDRAGARMIDRSARSCCRTTRSTSPRSPAPVR
jgi:hypothetical protein